MSKPLGSIAPWFGCKRSIAPWIVEQFGPHRAYWEPFCGGLAVLLAKPVVSAECVNDLHGGVVNLARTLADERCALDLYGRLSGVLCCEQLLYDVHEWLGPDRGALSIPDPDWAFRFMVCSWMGRSGMSGTTQNSPSFPIRYSANGGQPAKRFMSAVESIPAWHRRLKNVAIVSRDAFELLERIEDAPGTVVYVDPPYLTKGVRYTYDFSSYDDHVRLARVLAAFQKARVVVSYYDDPAICDLYSGWKVLKRDVPKRLSAPSHCTSRAVECLLINN